MFRKRRAVAYALIGLFTFLPYVPINGRPAMLLDIARREFSLFGSVFFPTDTGLLAMLIVSVFVTIFLLTALFGRVWCGWACPQTVYMEFLVRPIERLFDGEPGKKRKTGAWRGPAKYATFLLACVFLAHTFLAYFVGVEQLRVWVTRSPLEHPVSFLVMAGVTVAMVFDFCFFREQTCLVACPYGRLQSVLLDRNSLIVSYDPVRGEPRGHKKRKSGTVPGGAGVSLRVLPAQSEVDQPGMATEPETTGDCIDCLKCVTTCPTGIDIRNGLQMECVHCTQCIDACDEVMDKIGRPRGLIRYSSQAKIEGAKPRLVRPRVVVYPVILLVLVTGFVSLLATKADADLTVIRATGGVPYFAVDDGSSFGTRVTVRVRNRTPDEVAYTLSVRGVSGASLLGADEVLTVDPRDIATRQVVVLVPAQEFGSTGQVFATIRVEGSDGFVGEKRYRLIGPAWAGPSPVEQATELEG